LVGLFGRMWWIVAGWALHPPVLGCFEADLWSLSAQRRLFQQADPFCEGRIQYPGWKWAK
jgi:hypothetical protein